MSAKYRQAILALVDRHPPGTILDELQLCRIITGDPKLWPYASGPHGEGRHPCYVELLALQDEGVLQHRGHNGCRRPPV